MSKQVSDTIDVNADTTNPGQFLACCGLLEIAEKLNDDGTEGRFQAGKFHLSSKKTLSDLLGTLAEQEPDSSRQLPCGLEAEPAIAPLGIKLGSRRLVLDAWTWIGYEKGRPRILADSSWKFWSGNQSSQKIWSSLREALRQQLKHGHFDSPGELFSERCFLKGRFGFDAQAAWDSLDVGYSPNDQGIPVSTSPAMEMLALVGLQRFRPMMVDRSTFEYATWGVMLSPAAAQAASSGSILVAPAERFRGTIIRRGKYGGLAYSTRLFRHAYKEAIRE